jgi:hypothetical protein
MPRSRRGLRRRGAARLLAGVGPGIEPAQPLPSVLIMGLPYPARYRADMDIAEIDVPAVLALGISTAGEFGHGPLKRRRPGWANRLPVGARSLGEPLPVAGGEHIFGREG